MGNNNIDEIREKIDNIDNEILELFKKRMNLSREISILKKENNIKIQDSKRETQILEKVEKSLPFHLKNYGITLFKTLFQLSKDYQK